MNEYERTRRERKAVALASFARGRGLKSVELKTFTAQERQVLADQTGVRTPSPDTWAHVVSVVEHLEKQEVEYLTKDSDPFRGLGVDA